MSLLTKKQITNKIAINIKEAREEKGMSQEELAHEAGLYRTYIGHLENARYTPTVYILYKIAKALKIPLDYFIRSIK